jgi:solute:Na+ symporter, SSS family
MELVALDIIVFLVFVVAVITIGLVKSRGGDSSEDYFLAGRGLSWWLIGFSLIAANISAEQFIGMSGQAAKDSIGLAVASYEWCAAITLVIVAFYFLPTFLRSGIYTIPEYLEYRFTASARTTMSLFMVVIYVGVTIATVIFLGAKAIDPLFHGTFLGLPMNITTLSWIIGILAAVYVAAGGLKACAWADLIQGSALIIGGLVIAILSVMALNDPSSIAGIDPAAVQASLGLPEGASLMDKLGALKESKMHMVLDADSSFLPWTALLLGIWIPNFYYWGLNQYIMQRTLGASALSEGQKGVVFAAFLKLVIPFIVCVPGIIAFTLFAGKMQESAMEDERLNAPVLTRWEAANAKPADSELLFTFDGDFAKLHPELAGEMAQSNARITGLPLSADEGLVLANQAVLAQAVEQDASRAGNIQQELIGYDYDGAFPMLIRYLTPAGLRGFVLAALMGAVISSLASMLNAASTIVTMDLYRTWINKNASQRKLVWVGRSCVPLFVIIGCLIAPQLANPKFKGAFAYIQEFQGFISPGILTIFLFGLFVKRSPRMCGWIGLALSPVIYGFLYLFWGDMAFLNRMAVTVGAISLVLATLTVLKPLPEPVTLPVQGKISTEESKGARKLGWVVIAMTVALYVIFW